MKTSFVAQFVAFVKGDEAEVQAIKAQRSAESGLKTHIAIMEGDLQKKEDAVADAREVLAEARINSGRVINDRDDYVRGLITAKNNLVDAEEALEAHTATLNFLRSELASLK
jgi:hypothetical protein